MGKGTDLAGELKTIRKAVEELSAFMQRVRPLLSKSDSALAEALKDVSVPGGGKGLKRVLKFIDDRVSNIANLSRE